MLRAKTAVVVLYAVTGLSALGSTPASANWFVGGTELADGSKVGLATTAKVDTAEVTTLPKLKIKVQCNTPTLANVEAPEIIGRNEVRAKSIIFEGCATIEPATGCPLEGQPSRVPTEPVKAVLTRGPAAPADRAVLTPQTKTLFAVVLFAEKDICAFEGKEPIQGAVTLALPTGQTEETSQAIEGLGSVENNSLELGGAKMFVERGKALSKLASGSAWSFH